MSMQASRSTATSEPTRILASDLAVSMDSVY